MMLKKFLQRVPTLAVIGLAGSAAWPILFPKGEAGATRGAVRPPSLRPPDPTGSPIRRNPFLSGRPPDAPPTTAAVLVARNVLVATKADAKATGPLERTPDDEDKAVAGMRLGGTFVDGREQLAVIDGRVYARGEPLKGRDGSPRPYIVAEIRKDRAVLRRGRRSFVLAFSDVPRPTTPKGNVAGPSGLAGREGPTGRPTATSTARPESGGRAKAPGAPAGPPIAMDAIMKLLLGAGGPTPGGSVSGSARGIDAASLSAGIEALMGRDDDIGRTGGPVSPTAGVGGEGP